MSLSARRHTTTSNGYAWIAKDRPRSADAVTAAILECAETLGRFPYMGHVGSTPGTHERVVTGLPYIVVYKIDSDNNEVQITAVFDGAQDREGEP